MTVLILLTFKYILSGTRAINLKIHHSVQNGLSSLNPPYTLTHSLTRDRLLFFGNLTYFTEALCHQTFLATVNNTL